MDKIKLEGLDLMRSRLKVYGGERQQDRMIRDKAHTLEKALLYSYQSCPVRKLGDEIECRALIEPNKLKPDYDDKIISIPFGEGYHTGDIFEWIGTDTKWLIYLENLTEKAYFRGDIRRCNYYTEWRDEDGKLHSSYMAVRGPVETTIQHLKQDTLNFDTPNRSLHVMMPKNGDTCKYFKRYSKFYIQGDETCWRVNAVDSISTPGILEFHADEYYANTNEDSDGIVGNIIKPTPTPEPSAIIGEYEIYPNEIYEYSSDLQEQAMWSIEEPNMPIKLVSKGNKAKLKWTAYYGGTFHLLYGNIRQEIRIKQRTE